METAEVAAAAGTNWVAIAGIAATAVTAISGFIVQARIAGRRDLEERRRFRYQELVELYTDAGKFLTAAEADMVATLHDYERERAPIDKVLQELTSSWHISHRLYLHHCPKGVHDAWDAVVDLSEEWAKLPDPQPGSQGSSQWEAVRDLLAQINPAINQFHIACASHLREVWPGDTGEGQPFTEVPLMDSYMKDAEPPAGDAE